MKAKWVRRHLGWALEEEGCRVATATIVECPGNRFSSAIVGDDRYEMHPTLAAAMLAVGLAVGAETKEGE